MTIATLVFIALEYWAEHRVWPWGANRKHLFALGVIAGLVGEMATESGSFWYSYKLQESQASTIRTLDIEAGTAKSNANAALADASSAIAKVADATAMADRLELEAAPRLLEGSHSIPALAKFAGMQAFVTLAGELDSEAGRLAQQLSSALTSAHWRVLPLPPRDPGKSWDVMDDGVQINFAQPDDLSAPHDSASEQQWRDALRAKEAAIALKAELRRSQIEARWMPVNSREPSIWNPDVPRGALWIRVLEKPKWFFMCVWGSRIGHTDPTLCLGPKQPSKTKRNQ
jgi:hypothetical protein